MISFQKNLAQDLTQRLVWKNSAENQPVAETQEIGGKNLEKKSAPAKLNTPEQKKEMQELQAREQESKAEDQKKLTVIEQKIAAAGTGPEKNKNSEDLKAAVESREIPAELQKMSRAQIRNLERKNPELLLKTCFWKIEEGDKLTPISNSSELKVGDKVKFSINEANGKNKNLEMGAGLRTLPGNIKVVEISGEKFFRASEGGPFVDKNGEYRAVRSHTNETIILVEPTADDQKTIEQLRKTRGQEFARNDVGFALDDFLAKANLTLTPESVDKFLAEMQKDPTASADMKAVAKEQAESIKKFAELWKDFNVATYKQGIASIESGGRYDADNHGRGANDTWNKRALGKYQFTVETLNGMDVPIKNETDITAFKQNDQLQEEIMDRFTSEHISRVRDNPSVVAQIGKGAYSIDQVLGAMHLGGAGALSKVERGQLGGTDYMGTSYANYMDRLKQPNKTT
ncbi:MAG: hypothetical protein WCV72_02765 [Patescibacteria group bacterium]